MWLEACEVAQNVFLWQLLRVLDESDSHDLKELIFIVFSVARRHLLPFRKVPKLVPVVWNGDNLRLKVNKDGANLVNLPERSFDFLLINLSCCVRCF